MNEAGVTLERRRLFARFWKAASGFWTGVRKREAWFLTLTLLAIILGQLFVQYRLNVWNRQIFDALEKRDISLVGSLALLFVPLALAAVAFNVGSVWGRLTTQRAWRAWLTDYQIDRWLKNGRYYQLNLVKGQHENPEFRIADDTRIATESPVDFAFGVTTAMSDGHHVYQRPLGGRRRHFIRVEWQDHRNSGLSCFCRRDLFDHYDDRDAVHRAPVRSGGGRQKSGGSRVSLCRHASS